MADDDFDVGAELASSSDLEKMQALAKEAVDIGFEVEAIESLLKTKTDRLNAIKTKEMVDIMTTAGVDEITVEGNKFKLSKYVSGSFPKVDPEVPESIVKNRIAVERLEEYDGAGLITADINVQFGRGNHNAFVDLRERLIEEGFTVIAGEKVNTASLHAFCRKRMEDGEPLDAEALGVNVGNFVKITPPKAPKEPKAKKAKG